MCGEKLRRHLRYIQRKGSPPRVRGKAICRMRWCKISRITPARAGKRRTGKVHRMPVEDHPRVCGEKAHMVCTHDAFRGSPPRVRGKAKKVKKRDIISKITPACAGKSLIDADLAAFGRDHPRVCGEKNSAQAIIINITGSPPRVRGKVRKRRKNI